MLLRSDGFLEVPFEDVDHVPGRVQANREVFRLQYDRLNSVAKSKPGLVAQQEVDDAQGKDLAAVAQVEGSKSNLQGRLQRGSVEMSLDPANRSACATARWVRLLFGVLEGLVLTGGATVGVLQLAKNDG
jgi:hypothetical protein